jgi:MFS family permease
MIGANLFCAGAVAVMLLGTSPGRYWLLYAALAAENSGTVLYAPALQARVPTVVGTGPLLSSANSLTSASGGIVRLIGGPLGGVLLAACGIRWLIGADAFSYLLAAAAMFMTSRSCRGHRDRNALVAAVARDLIEGTRGPLRPTAVNWPAAAGPSARWKQRPSSPSTTRSASTWPPGNSITASRQASST